MLACIKSLCCKFGIDTKVVKNTWYLLLIQVANLIIPLFLIKLLIERLGLDNYGLISIAQAIIAYFILFCDYGFNLSCTRKIAQAKSNKEDVELIIGNVLFIKTFFSLAVFILLIFFYFLFPSTHPITLLVIGFYGMVIGGAIYPQWAFQGLERMSVISILNLIFKSLSLLLVFLFVKSGNDTMTYALITSAIFLLPAITALLILKKDYRISFGRVTKEGVKKELRDGWFVFLPTIFSMALTNAGVLILGAFGTKVMVGAYAAVEKIIKALLSLFSAFTTALFPHISALFSHSYQDAVKSIKKYAYIGVSVAVLICLLLMFFPKIPISFLLSEENYQYTFVLQILSVWIIFGVLNNFIGIQYLIGSGKQKLYFYCMFFASMITIALLFVFTYFFQVRGTSSAIVLGEIALTLAMLFSIKKMKYEKNTVGIRNTSGSH